MAADVGYLLLSDQNAVLDHHFYPYNKTTGLSGISSDITTSVSVSALVISDSAALACGVPQGTLLVPALFPISHLLDRLLTISMTFLSFFKLGIATAGGGERKPSCCGKQQRSNKLDQVIFMDREPGTRIVVWSLFKRINRVLFFIFCLKCSLTYSLH